MDDLRLHAVNWQDGMLITRQHFADEQKYHEALARWYSIRAGDQYGLIRRSSDSEPALKMQVQAHGGHVRVELLKCQAITSDGRVIEINEESGNAAYADVDNVSGEVPVFLSVSPGNRKQTGTPDAEEEIPRLPYLVREYALHVGERPSMPESRLIKIAVLKSSAENTRVDTDYFPPCLTLYSDEHLNLKSLAYRDKLDSLLIAVTRAHSRPTKDVPGSLETDLRTIVREFGTVLASNIDSVVTGPNSPHPMMLVNLFKRLYRSLLFLIELYPAVEDFLNDRFFQREKGYSSQSFVTNVNGFLMESYDHTDIAGHCRAIDEINDTLHNMFAFLAQGGPVDARPGETYTYMGKTFTSVSYSGHRCDERPDGYWVYLALEQTRSVSDVIVLMEKSLFELDQWSSMQTRLSFNDSVRLGLTDPATIDTHTSGSRVILRAQDVVKSSAVNQVNIVFRGPAEFSRFENISPADLMIYAAD
jgi:hypothetical protein